MNNDVLREYFDEILEQIEDYLDYNEQITPLYLNNLELPKGFTIIAPNIDDVRIFNNHGRTIGNIILYNNLELDVEHDTSLYIKYVYYYGLDNQIYFDFYDLSGKKKVSYKMDSPIIEVYTNSTPKYISL